MSEEPRHTYLTADEKELIAKYTTDNNSINRPTHYNQGKIEVIDFIEDQKLGFHLGNVVKYLCRAGKKDNTTYYDDLKKAEWYLQRYISLINVE